jgi:class 3 adenylate cyclase
MMRCSSCGHDNPEAARFCEECAAELARICSKCGAANSAQAKFCTQCRTALMETSVAAAGVAIAAAAAPTATAATPLPTSFAGSRYHVQRFLGEGGRKRVYLAHDSTLDRDVAVAVIKTEGLDEGGLSRVKREAQAMGRLGDHPNIVTVFDIGDDGGQPYIVSQFMGGGDLDGMLNKAPDRRLPVAEALRIARQVQEGLAHAHSRGIIHRDLKPGNIWLTEDGTAKIGDFGLAVAVDRSRLTMEGMMVGTVAYMAPEQALGRQPDARSDLYSLGCVTYEMLTGRAPFLGDDPVAIISQHINTAPVAPSWHNPEVPRALESLILRLLAKDPNDRPESAAAIPQALQAIVDSASTTAPLAAESDVNPLDRLATGIFVGREKEMDELRAGLEDALSGRGRLMMLVGEPGIGKTRTSEEFATYARLRNAQVLWGRCYEGEGAPAYWPWVQIIRSYVHDKEPQALMSEMGPGAADIAQVVSDVKDRLPGLPVPPALEPDQARFRLFDSITTFLKNASKGAPLMVVLDDMHWADKPSLLLLQFLAKELRGSRLMVLGTYRDVELRRQHPLAQTLGELNRENLSQRVLLRGLTENDVRRFVEVTAGTSPPDSLVQAVYRETEGNPFFVNEIVRLLVADGRLEQGEAVKEWSVTIPQSVREVVGRRLDHLSEACNRVLTIGSVIGREFGLRLLEKVSEVKGDALLEALEEAMSARVIAELPRTTDQYWFSHALIRETLYEELSTTRRVRLHRQIGEALEELDAEGSLPQLAYHFAEAAPGGDVETAVAYARKAGEKAVALFAWEDAVTQFERALQVLDLQTPKNETLTCDLLMALADAQFCTGDEQVGQSTYGRAADAARRLKDGDRFALAALGYARPFSVGLVDERLIALLNEALAGISEDDSAVRARLLSRLGRELYFRSLEEFERLTNEGVAMARRVGDKQALSYALWDRAWGGNALYGAEERLADAEEMLQLAEEAHDRERAAFALFTRIMNQMILGDTDGADSTIDEWSRVVGELRMPAFAWQLELARGMRVLFGGSMDDAENAAQSALAIGQRASAENAAQMFGAQFYAIRREQARLQEMEAGIQGFVQMYPAVPAWRTAIAFNYAEQGKLDQARTEFEVLAKDGFSIFPRDGNWPAALGLLSDTCALLGDKERARYLYDQLLPVADRCIVIGAAVDCFGACHRFLGLLATTMERWDDAERHFHDAMEMNVRMHAGRNSGWTFHQYADMLLRRDGLGDREKALSLLSQALDVAERLGLTALLQRSLALKLRAQGADLTDIGTSIDTVAREALAEQPNLRAHAAPDGTVTLLFTDIEGSTALNERLGDQRWMDVLRAHNAIVRDAVGAHGGYEVKSQGDGFMIAFGSARRALHCAIDLQRAIADHNRRDGEPIRVRIGLHTGEAVREADDFYGHHVNLAARIASQACGGEILVSALLKELTDSSGDIRFGDVREVELKGLTGPQRVFSVGY